MDTISRQVYYSLVNSAQVFAISFLSFFARANFFFYFPHIEKYEKKNNKKIEKKIIVKKMKKKIMFYKQKSAGTVCDSLIPEKNE
jgi:hypothetical protein